MKNSATIIPVSSDDCQVNSWKSQLKSAFSRPESLLEYLQLKPNDYRHIIDSTPHFALRVPRAFADKMQPGDINDPLLQQVLSVQQENLSVKGFVSDPLQEQENHQPGLLHKYHGRVLLLLTGSCAVNCRYCFRRHFPYQTSSKESDNLQANLDYIATHVEISEVILSGGDPLLLSDSKLSKLISQLDAIPHLRHLRIHSRLPIVIPDRLTEQLSRLLNSSRLTTTLVIHANHANEIDLKTGRLLQQLVQSGTNVLNQSVLLKGINDSVSVLSDLSRQLSHYQILPYYLHLLDPVEGAAHFDCNKTQARQIMQELRAQLPGYLVPRLAMEEPNQPYKTLIQT